MDLHELSPLLRDLLYGVVPNLERRTKETTPL